MSLILMAYSFSRYVVNHQTGIVAMRKYRKTFFFLLCSLYERGVELFMKYNVYSIGTNA